MVDSREEEKSIFILDGYPVDDIVFVTIREIEVNSSNKKRKNDGLDDSSLEDNRVSLKIKNGSLSYDFDFILEGIGELENLNLSRTHIFDLF